MLPPGTVTRHPSGGWVTKARSSFWTRAALASPLWKGRSRCLRVVLLTAPAAAPAPASVPVPVPVALSVSVSVFATFVLELLLDLLLVREVVECLNLDLAGLEETGTGKSQVAKGRKKDQTDLKRSFNVVVVPPLDMGGNVDFDFDLVFLGLVVDFKLTDSISRSCSSSSSSCS